MDLDLSALQAEVASLSEEELKAQLLELRTKQKVQQKKYSNSDTQKAYRQKKAEINKLIAKRAKELGFYDSIVKQATEAAEQKVAAEKADLEDDSEAAA